jgi:hypothetical protein
LENPGKFAVIFEYGINIITCSGLKSYAQQWHDLIALEPGTTAYNNALENITNVFTLAGTGGAKPNGSSLNQIRTNELALDIFPWELREFAIDPATHKLVATTVKQTPRDNFSGSSTLAHYANSNAMAILNNTYVVPEIIPPDTNFLGARAHTNLPSTIWDAEPEATGTHIIHDDTVRHLLSLNTCNGCHGGEGKTSVGNLIDDPASTDHDAFLHITPRSFGTKATLSAFLTGDPADAEGLFRVNDPALRPNPTTPWQWTFNDLQRRADDLEVLTMTTCKSKVMDLLRVISFKPVNMVH